MNTYALIFLLSFFTAYIITPAVRKLAIKVNAIDMPEKRKIHAFPTPRMGGLAIFIAFIIALAVGIASNPKFLVKADSHSFIAFLIGALIVAIIGIIDDIKGLSALPKFTGQAIAASCFLYFSPPFIDQFAIPFTDNIIHISYPVSFVLSLLWITAIMNAINFIDGLDGLANGICFLASLTLFIINLNLNQFFLAFIYASICGASLGFAKYNEYPAKIFLGDTGSLLWGYILSCLGLMSTTKSTTLSVMLIPMVTLGIPLFDVLIAIIRRSIAGDNIFKADKKHIHHRLLQKGFTQQEAVRVLYIICVILCVTSFIIVNTRDEYAALIIIVIGLVSFMLSSQLNLLWTPEKGIKNINKKNSEKDESKKTSSDH